MNVILLASISIDGYIGRDESHVSLDWTSPEDKKHFVATTKAAGVMVMGSKTFATIGRGLPGRKIYVYTTHPEKIAGIEGVEPTALSPSDLLLHLERQGFQDVVIAGGASVYSLFMKAQLVDELVLTVEPVLFGKGVSLLADGMDGHLQLAAVDKLNQDTLLLRYKPVR